MGVGTRLCGRVPEDFLGVIVAKMNAVKDQSWTQTQRSVCKTRTLTEKAGPARPFTLSCLTFPPTGAYNKLTQPMLGPRQNDDCLQVYVLTTKPRTPGPQV